ncbi:hypothetical protein CJ030_MR0G008509 [Morella rubra]|uniref:Uncharacterized protein n=1 Tax=Morella rubra TaxID=262757 RepID=A0A6A1UJ85_9ROSI|nr:hypothetical protein CJ030_MR0G008509 [Morella rubra]
MEALGPFELSLMKGVDAPEWFVVAMEAQVPSGLSPAREVVAECLCPGFSGVGPLGECNGGASVGVLLFSDLNLVEKEVSGLDERSFMEFSPDQDAVCAAGVEH